MSDSAAVPRQPAHPWSDLSWREDRLLLRSRAGAETDYLATPEVRIADKKSLAVAADGASSAYAFELNTTPDAVWRDIFAEIVDRPPPGIHRADLRVEVADDTLTLWCMPTHLETKFAFVKAAVAEANASYKEERAAVQRRVAELDAKKRRDETAEQTKAGKIQERFDRLKL